MPLCGRYTFWSSDFHVAPIADLKEIFNPMGMTVIDKSLSRHCTRTSTCAKDLKVSSAGALSHTECGC
jgi:hypothetical protein